MKLWLDLETYSETPINVGTYRYAANCEVMLLSYAVDTGPVEVLDFTAGHKPPWSIFEDSDPVVAHNSMFDRNVLKYALGIDIPPEHWRDTMVQAMAHALPGGLDKLCDIFKLPIDKAKDKRGRELVHLFCKPRPKNSVLRRATRDTHPKEWAEFIEYARLDVEAMRALAGKLPTWNYGASELALWHLDQRINDRGMLVDLELARGAVAAVEAEQARLSERTEEITGGDVARTTERDKLLAHILGAYGVTLPDMQATTIERRLNDPELPAELKELLALRLSASTSSTAKYKALLAGISADGRVRGTLQFNGAGRTRRWAGRKPLQPQNLPSRGLLPPEEIEAGIPALKAGAADLVCTDVMSLASGAIRGVIAAPPGKKLVISDLSNIEGRVQAWLAGEEWKLKAFRAFDAGQGPDLYKLAYAKSFGVKPDEVTKDQRQIGKVKELMFGYEGGVGAWITGAKVYDIDLDTMACDAIDQIPADVLDEARGMWDWCLKEHRDTYGLAQDTFVVCDAFKRMTRRAQPNITALWRGLKDAAISAVLNPGQEFHVRRLMARRDGAWLRIRLPSGNWLCYPQPKIEDGMLSYMGQNQYTRQWSRLYTYGGKLFENACQSLARDFMSYNMPAAETAGYEILLTVHDELVTEAPDTPEYSAERLSKILATVPDWAPGMPLAAAGFETYRYRKD